MTTTQPDLVQLRYSKAIGRPIDNTALSAYMRCPAEYDMAYRQHRRRRGAPPPAIAFGSVMHVGLETHYKYVPPPHLDCKDRSARSYILNDLYQTVEVSMASRWEDHQAPDDYRTLDRALLEYRKFLDENGLPWEEDAKTVGWPSAPLVEISSEVAIPGARHPYAVKIDRVIQINGQYFVEDYKTTSRDDKGFFAQFELDNQMMGYAYVAQQLTGKPISGVRIRRFVVRKNDSFHDKRTISIGQDRLQHWAANYDWWLDRIERDMLGADGFGAFPRNFSSCSRKFGRCPYVGVCSLSSDLWQETLEQDFDVIPWNPLEAAVDASEVENA